MTADGTAGRACHVVSFHFHHLIDSVMNIAFCRPAGLALLLLSAACPALAVESPHANRIWVDATGQYSVRANLIDWNDTSVRLLRTDGGEVTLPIAMLSEQDKAYLAENKSGASLGNGLRGAPPTPPEIKPQPVLKLPRAQTTASSGAMLGNEGKQVKLASDGLPKTLPADRSPQTVTIDTASIPLPKIDFNMAVSEPVAVSIDTANNRVMALVASISGNIRLPGESTRQELVRFDVADQAATVTMRHYKKIHLLDHHLDSGQSLALIGQNSLGRGGDLVVVRGWSDDVLGFANRRGLFVATVAGAQVDPPELRWAKWVDDQHVAAMVNQTIGVWNIVSGEQLFRIDEMDTRCEPAISGGGRYLAVPRHGSVDLIATETGQSLGRIKVEGEVPGVQFSPLGNQLAITTMRRLRVWDLDGAALAADVRSRNSLGKGHPLWIDHDLILTESGTLVSLFRGVPVWRYEIAGTERSSIGGRIAVLRKEPTSELTLLELPHEAAKQMLRRIDASPIGIDPDRWQIPGRSAWQSGAWVDRDVEIGSMTSNRR
jgi:hypothetical protein